MGVAGLYAHVPFCTTKCDYCAFHSLTAWTISAQEAIVDKIIDDARILCGESGGRPDTLYIGGGTPSVLGRGLTERLICGLRSAASGTVIEVSCEANPGSAETSFLHEAAAAGVNRLCLGVQTLDPDLSSKIGRTPTTRHELERIRREWAGKLAADLIVGIPGQSTAEVLSELSWLSDLGISHFSIYDLSIEPGTPLASRLPDWNSHGVRRGSDVHGPDADEPEWQELCRCLASNGFARYEISSFARPGSESLHNLGYWRARPYIGVGPGAVSTIVLDGTCTRMTRTRDHSHFLVTDPVSGSAPELLSREVRMREYLMLGLRTSEGVSLSHFARRFGQEINAYIGPPLDELVGAGYLTLLDDRIRPTQLGMDFLNQVLLRLP